MRNLPTPCVLVFLFAFASLSGIAQNSDLESNADYSADRIKAYTLFKPTFQSNNYDIALMKYIDYNYVDTTLGVLFRGYSVLPGRNPGFMHQFTATVDQSEITPILYWLDDIRNEVNKNPKFEYLFYEPVDNKIMFFIEKNINSYSLYVQYDKHLWYTNQVICKIGYSSKDGYDFDRFDVFYNQISEIDEAINRYLQN
jgi:hypothetical protein